MAADEEEEADAVAVALIAVFCELSDVETELVADDDEPDPSLIIPSKLTRGTCPKSVTSMATRRY